MGDIKFVEDEGTCQCTLCAANMALRASQKPHYGHAKNTDSFEDTQYLICPPRVLGYHLNGKRWVELDVNLVSEIENLTDASSFRRLELNPVQKELIKKLVKNHASGTEKLPFMRDLMKGKGNGLVILLHGIQYCLQPIPLVILTHDRSPRGWKDTHGRYVRPICSLI